MQRLQVNLQLGSGWMVLSALGFALMGYFVKLLAPYLAYPELAFWRMAIASLVLGLTALLTRRQLQTAYFSAHLIRGVIGTTGIFLTFYLLTHLPLATAVTLGYTSAIWTVIFSVIFFRQTFSLPVIASVILGFGGVILLLNPTFSKGQTAATLVGVISGAVSALAYMQTRELTLLKEPEWRIVFYFSVIATVIAGVWSSFTGFHSFSLTSLSLIIAMALSALLGQICLTLAYAQGNLLVNALLSYLTIVFSFFLGYFLLGDYCTLKELGGILLIIGSGVAGGIMSSPAKLARIMKIFRRGS